MNSLRFWALAAALVVAAAALAAAAAGGPAAASAPFTRSLLVTNGQRYRYQLTVAFPPSLAAAANWTLGPPGISYVTLASRVPLSLQVKNRTTGRPAPLFGPLDSSNGVTVQLFYPVSATMAAHLRGSPIGALPASIHWLAFPFYFLGTNRPSLTLNPGGSLSLAPTPIQYGSTIVSGLRFPDRDKAAWRAVLSHPPAYISFAFANTGAFAAGAPTCGPNEYLLGVFPRVGRVLSCAAASQMEQATYHSY